MVSVKFFVVFHHATRDDIQLGKPIGWAAVVGMAREIIDLFGCSDVDRDHVIIDLVVEMVLDLEMVNQLLVTQLLEILW